MLFAVRANFVKDVIAFNDALAKNDIEFYLFKGRRDLVLLDCGNYVDADDVSLFIFDRIAACKRDADRGVKWNCFRYITVISRSVGLYLQLAVEQFSS